MTLAIVLIVLGVLMELASVFVLVTHRRAGHGGLPLLFLPLTITSSTLLVLGVLMATGVFRLGDL